MAAPRTAGPGADVPALARAWPQPRFALVGGLWSPRGTEAGNAPLPRAPLHDRGFL